MKSQIVLGRLFGIKIGLHYSWFLIALLIVFSLSADFHAGHPQWNEAFAITVAFVTALFFFVSLLLHELAHSLVARAHGLPVREITLFALGGVSQIEKEATSAREEFLIAIVGPLTSALIGILCLGAAVATGGGTLLKPSSQNPSSAMLLWLGYINLGLAAFNMIPGYPMDGGRVLRALLWWKSGNLERSTRNATRAGQAVATVFIVLGIIGFFRGGGLGSLWIAFIGWFLLQAAKESYMEGALRKMLDGVRVRDLMAQDCRTVDGHSSIQQFVDDELLPSGRRCFIVVEDGNVAGLVTPHEIRHIRREMWPLTPLDTAMLPLDRLRTVPPDTPLMKALEVMGRDDINQLPVVLNGKLEGVLSRERVFSYLKTRLELQA